MESPQLQSAAPTSLVFAPHIHEVRYQGRDAELLNIAFRLRPGPGSAAPHTDAITTPTRQAQQKKKQTLDQQQSEPPSSQIMGFEETGSEPDEGRRGKVEKDKKGPDWVSFVRHQHKESAAWILSTDFLELLPRQGRRTAIPERATATTSSFTKGERADWSMRQRLMWGVLATWQAAAVAASPATAPESALKRGPPAAVRKRGRLEVSVLRDPMNVRRLWSSNREPHCSLRSVQIRAGDNLGQLSGRYGVSVRELQRLNGMASDVLYEGDQLRVPAAPLLSPAPQLRPGVRRTGRLLFVRPEGFVRPPCLCGPAACLHASRSQKSEPHQHHCRHHQQQQRQRQWPQGSCSCTLLPRGLTAAPYRWRSPPSIQGRWKRAPRGFSRLLDGWLPFGSPIRDSTSFVSSRFGPRWERIHEGVDVAADEGVPIRAVGTGHVVYSGNQGVYGNLIEVDHGNGFLTRYAHCSKLLACKGQRVARGQVVGLVGSTGRVTGPHLHLEVRRNGIPVDPLQWCNF